jgi:hypothetical protein
LDARGIGQNIRRAPSPCSPVPSETGAPATTETRVALVAFERGISAKELERFYYVNRKGSKKRYFDNYAFAEKYGVSVHWLWEGDLCEHPRGLTRQRTRKSSRRPAQPQGGAA